MPPFDTELLQDILDPDAEAALMSLDGTTLDVPRIIEDIECAAGRAEEALATAARYELRAVTEAGSGCERLSQSYLEDAISFDSLTTHLQAVLNTAVVIPASPAAA